MVVIKALHPRPALKLTVLLEEKPQGFADDVGLVAADEFGISVQVQFDALFDAYLDQCVLRLLWWCFQNGQWFSPFVLQIGQTVSDKLFAPLLHRGQNAVTQQACRAGATPRTFWAAESRKSGVAPARFSVFSDAVFLFTQSRSRAN
jgi:hypothetical protein